jgi:hypothetical protein
MAGAVVLDAGDVGAAVVDIYSATLDKDDGMVRDRIRKR